MTSTMTDDHAAQQRPEAGALVLDHLAHFVPEMGAAERDLERFGFTLTPLSHQMHRTAPDAPLVSAGTANRTAMLERGYLEFLTTTGDTPNAAKLKAAMARYTGAHLVCFGTTESNRVHARLATQGFAPPPVVEDAPAEAPADESDATPEAADETVVAEAAAEVEDEPAVEEHVEEPVAATSDEARTS